MEQMNQQRQLILASQSPRRSEILRKAGYQFVPLPVYVSEIPNKNLSVDEQILDIAERKARAATKQYQAQYQTQHQAESPARAAQVILSADTMVCLGPLTLGKPESPAQAAEFLRLLSGRAHAVKTAIYLIDLMTNEHLSHLETTQIIFRELSENEIQSYIAGGEPLDKAGAYAIQGEGRNFVAGIEGDFDNVVGLPLHALENLFKLKAWTFLRTP
jgi:septum formation protein